MADCSAGSSCPSRTSGTGLYFTVFALESLSKTLDNLEREGNWRTLAGVVGFDDNSVQNYEAKMRSAAYSPTMAMLRDYQNRKGGINFDEFEDILSNLGKWGRRDIITDIWIKENENKLLEPRKKEILQCHSATPDIKCQCDERNNLSSVRNTEIDHYHTPSGSWHERDVGSRHAVRPKSDPPTRRSVAPSRHSDCFTDELPQNLKGSRSDDMVVRQGPKDTPFYPTSNDNSPSPYHRRQCKEKYQQGSPAGVLRSWDPSLPRARTNNVSSPHVPFPLPRKYLVVSSEKDKMLCRKLKKLIEKKRHPVWSVHDLKVHQLEDVFKVVLHVVVIYTENYLAEIQKPNTLNTYVYHLIKQEHMRSDRRNRRFIPIYDTTKIRALPQELLDADMDEVNYVVGLMNGITPPPGPVIVREPHSHHKKQNSR